MTGRHVFFEGRVQGVGFRWTAKTIARGYEVTGWVRNLPDGRVEMKVSGEPDEVDGFIEAIEESDLRAHIRKVDVAVIPPLTGTNGFEIAP